MPPFITRLGINPPIAAIPSVRIRRHPLLTRLATEYRICVDPNATREVWQQHTCINNPSDQPTSLNSMVIPTISMISLTRERETEQCSHTRMIATRVMSTSNPIVLLAAILTDWVLPGKRCFTFESSASAL